MPGYELTWVRLDQSLLRNRVQSCLLTQIALLCDNAGVTVTVTTHKAAAAAAATVHVTNAPGCSDR